MSGNTVTWPGSNGTVFDAALWATRTVDSGGGVGADTFTIQSGNGRIGLTAVGNVAQQARYIHARGNHSTRFEYRGTINWSTLQHATTFCVRSDNVAYGNATTEAANCYVFEFDTTAGTVGAYKSTSSTPAAITGAAAFTSFVYGTSVTYNVYFSLLNYTLGVKIWTGAEPGSFTYTVTDPDTSILSSTVGSFMWGNYHVNAATASIDIGPATFSGNLDMADRHVVLPQALRRASLY